MNKYKNNLIFKYLARLSALSLLLCVFSAEATAPRIAAQMFGEEKKADIVAYQLAHATAEAELTQAIVTEAFKAAGSNPILDELPSKQLATYALFNQDALAMIGKAEDLLGQDKKLYVMVPFYLRNTQDEPVVLIVNATQGKTWLKAFNRGMQIILKNGQYQQLLDKFQGQFPADYAARLKRLNPSWR